MLPPPDTSPSWKSSLGVHCTVTQAQYGHLFGAVLLNYTTKTIILPAPPPHLRVIYTGLRQAENTMPSGENGCGMGETNSSRQPSFESDLHAVDGGQRRFLRLTLSDSWIGVRVVYETGLENQRCIRVRGFESYRSRQYPQCMRHVSPLFRVRLETAVSAGIV